MCVIFGHLGDFLKSGFLLLYYLFECGSAFLQFFLPRFEFVFFAGNTVNLLVEVVFFLLELAFCTLNLSSAFLDVFLGFLPEAGNFFAGFGDFGLTEFLGGLFGFFEHRGNLLLCAVDA